MAESFSGLRPEGKETGLKGGKDGEWEGDRVCLK